MIERRLIQIEGLVQGVGFRPFVHELATKLALRGKVWNAADGIAIDVEGERSMLDNFVRTLTSSPPPHAIIERLTLEAASTTSHHDFRIAPSIPSQTGAPLLRIPTDVAVCDDCLRELFDPHDRRYRYAFLSCSHCGPRFTIAHAAPYDRETTTMAPFGLCHECRAEYDEPANRRFHAQTIACRECGPSLVLAEIERERMVAEDAVARAVELLASGQIVAVKGIGGFHLACDATNPVAVQRLRLRKRREGKPFAVMVRDLDAATRLCHVNEAEARLLTSAQRPIVLLTKRSAGDVADEVAPANRFLGVMLPYTPLHFLLLNDVGRPLVMTSGNASDEPIAQHDDEALARLCDIADAFLMHDRAIATRCDDSVVRVTLGEARFLRRSRGFTPRPITLQIAAAAPVLAVGGHLKNTFCLAIGQSAIVSHHIGDLHNPDGYAALQGSIAHYRDLFGVTPAVVAHDLHPDYLSTRLAEELGVTERVAVQHHHAHIASCVAEHGFHGMVIGVAFDGTGYGTDGAIWGGEFLVVDGARCSRAGHLSYVPLPGGDSAIRHPWRAAVAHLWQAYDGDLTRAPNGFVERHDAAQLGLVRQALTRRSLAPPTSSVGRLFDAVASILGIRDSAQFEGQAAMELEMAADPTSHRRYSFDLCAVNGKTLIDAGSLVRAVVHDMNANAPIAEIAAAFHNTLAAAAATVVRRIAREAGTRHVALSGGCFQNALLTERLLQLLSDDGLEVLLHRQVPCNDGGLALGQAYVAALVASPTVATTPSDRSLCA